jgi:hypothetical protein
MRNMVAGVDAIWFLTADFDLDRVSQKPMKRIAIDMIDQCAMELVEF